MIVVSGCPRSMTSCMMDQLRVTFGDDKIVGSKFPQEHRNEKNKERLDNEEDIHYENRIYIQNKMLKKSRETEMANSKDMNPNGFWECRYSVRGISWHPGVENIAKKENICKIVSQGLANSDPQFIDKIILMVRNPREVAKSQEKLRRMPFIDAEEEASLKNHTPEMFIKVSYALAEWIIKYGSEIPLLLVRSEELVTKPDETLSKVGEFIGKGDFSNHTVDPKLRRSKPEDIEHRLWVYADKIYQLLLDENWKELVKYFNDNSKEIYKEDIRTPCLRLGRQVWYKECINCRSIADTRKNFKNAADINKIDWKDEPCIFECLTNPNGELISIKDSIENNSWLDLRL